VPVHQTAQRIEIERTVVRHRGDNRNQTASDHIYFRHPVFFAICIHAVISRRSKTKLGILIHLTGRAYPAATPDPAHGHGFPEIEWHGD
jgi:hypothetical protein